MSRIGKKSIILPNDVNININNNCVTVNGKFGSLERSFLNHISIVIANNILTINLNNSTKEAQAYYGLSRALLNNMIIGVTSKFEKILILEGVGYKFQLENDKLVLNVGFSHPVIFSIPKNIKATLESSTKLILSSINLEDVGLLAAKIRNVRPPEPYKGKGIRYFDEFIRRKAGKTRK